MKKMSAKQLLTTGLLVGVIGLSGAPMTAGASSNDWNRDRDRGRDYHDDRRDDRRDRRDDRRIISAQRAIRIAKNVFPRKQVVSLQLRWDRGVREYQVRFRDGSRVDVRARDGRITHVINGRAAFFRYNNVVYRR